MGARVCVCVCVSWVDGYGLVLVSIDIKKVGTQGLALKNGHVRNQKPIKGPMLAG